MRFEAQDFEGLMPAIDPRKSDKVYALSGRNYVFDSFGPRSVFGNRFITPYPFGRPEHAEGARLRLRTGDRTFTFTSDAILEWNETLGGFRVIYYFNESIELFPYRWTYDYLSGIMFFCHPAVGILAYIVDSDLCQPLEGPGVPSEPIAIAVVSGRLAAIDERLYSWSAPGDGTKWTPELGGAGFQEINARVPGYPIMVSAYARGAIVWTTGGVMRSEFTGDAEVFRHRALVTEYRPINSYCTFRLDNDTIGFLDERGFFSTQGEAPRPLTPLFNEFLIDYVQRMNLKLGQNIRVDFDDLTRRLFLSVSLSELNPLYEKAFVLYQPLDKWGTFDEEHYGILPALIKESSRRDDYFGFVDSTGRYRYWNGAGSREILPVDPTLNSYYPPIQKPVVQQLDGDAVILASTATFNTVPTAQYTQRAGYYGVVGTSPAVSNVTGLDASVSLGLVRAKSEISHDRMVEICQIMVGSILSDPSPDPIEDWAAIPEGQSDEDYNAETGGEDFGVEDVTYVNHGLRIIGTNDGVTTWQETNPIMFRYDRAVREFAGSCMGIWHIIELSATEIGEAFHVRFLELTAIDGGRLN
jgi:hypothetical protein